MDTSVPLQRMKDYLVRVLEQSGEFLRIEPGYDCRDKSDNPALRKQAQRQVFCELKPAYSPTGKSLSFLIIAHAEEKGMPKALFAEKIAAASTAGIYTANVLYRYINSGQDPETQGPFFRRFYLDEDRADDASFHRVGAPRRRSLQHYNQERRNNFRITREIEREWVPAVSAGMAMYYQPASARLPETLKRYDWGDVIFRGRGRFDESRVETSVEIKEPTEKEDLSLWTLQPLLRRELSTSTRRLVERDALLADVVAIPAIDVQSDDERIVRHNLGLLEHQKKYGIENPLEDPEERISIQLDSLLPAHPLGEYFERLLRPERV